MLSAKPLLFFVITGLCQQVLAASAGHVECERQFKLLSKGLVISVPEVRDWGSAKEHYFAWNPSDTSKMLKTKRGDATGACIVDRKTGEGFLTLNGKDLGSFKAKGPL